MGLSLNMSSPDTVRCFDWGPDLFILSAYFLCRTIFLLPLSVFILHSGHQQWQQQQSLALASHSDIFTYHMVVIELISIVGHLFFLSGRYYGITVMYLLGSSFSSACFFGEMYFHILTCVERYVAVVHPVTYQGLRNARGIKIRNITVGCVWLLCFCSVSATVCYFPGLPFDVMLGLVVFSIVVITFCSLSVLHALNRPRPGNDGKSKEKMAQSTQRALIMIGTISGAEGLWLSAYLIAIPFESVNLVDICVFIASIAWLNLPCSMVLPLLYLLRHRR